VYKMKLNGVRHFQKWNGFTIIELLVVIILVVVLVAFAIPTYLNLRDDEQVGLVKANMHIAQMAADAYATASGGVYPPSSDDLGYLSFFPGGSKDIAGTKPGNFPINPFSHRAQPPQAGAVVDVEGERMQTPKRLGLPGQLFYSPIIGSDETGVTSYAIQGAGKDGIALRAVKPELTLVLSKPASSPPLPDQKDLAK
jgi:prepilin-type N-terminal cleavage/methylation domain-containing protein